MMQTDPAKAIEYYSKHDPEKLNLMKKFMGILGKHMSEIDTKKEDSDSRKKERDVILEKPKIKELIGFLKTNPERANYIIRSNHDEEFREDVRILLASGDLNLNAM